MFHDCKTLVGELQMELLGTISLPCHVEKNSENLATNGDMCFPYNLLHWGASISNSDIDNCKNILEHYLRRKKIDTDGLSEEDILKKATELLLSASKSMIVPFKKCTLNKGKVCVFLDRRKLIEMVIKEVVKQGDNYGKTRSNGKKVIIEIMEDKESELTTERLKLVSEVTKRILQIRGVEIVEENANTRCLLTTKSKGPIKDGFERYVCGVVKNQNSNTKETSLTWSSYIDKKIDELASLAEEKFSELNERCNLEKIAQAIVTFELLAVNPNRAVFVQCSTDSDKAVSSLKGGSFVLYNAARISAIFEKFKKEVCLGNYPNLLDINKVEFEHLNQEEEWELVYTFIYEYPTMIDKSVSCSVYVPRPQNLCRFLSRLSQRFSVYYRRVRILTEGHDHLMPTMMARLYLLQALQIIVNNCLAILNIEQVRHM